jgi:PBP1b-binding outer membrane lipoprotein LpoB
MHSKDKVFCFCNLVYFTSMKKILLIVFVAVLFESCATEKENYRLMYPGRVSQKANTQSCGSSILVKPKFKEK